MREDFLTQQIREAIREWGEKPPEEQWQDLIDDGIIDEQGRVLRRMPEPPYFPEGNSPAPTGPSERAQANGQGGADPVSHRSHEALGEWVQLPPAEQSLLLMAAGIIDVHGHLLKRATQTPVPSNAPAKPAAS